MILSNVAHHQQDTEAVMRHIQQLEELADHKDLLWLKAQSLVELSIENLKEGELAALEVQIRSAIDIAESIRYEGLLVKAYNTAGAINNVRNDLAKMLNTFSIKGYNLGKSTQSYL
ncbi:hypothetical protein O9992_17980 [Vibrio lentus]|nr:hypothetical protein [Vibrio lentus]